MFIAFDLVLLRLMAIKHLWTWPNKTEKHWTGFNKAGKRFEHSQSKKCSTLFNLNVHCVWLGLITFDGYQTSLSLTQQGWETLNGIQQSGQTIWTFSIQEMFNVVQFKCSVRLSGSQYIYWLSNISELDPTRLRNTEKDTDRCSNDLSILNPRNVQRCSIKNVHCVWLGLNTFNGYQTSLNMTQEGWTTLNKIQQGGQTIWTFSIQEMFYVVQLKMFTAFEWALIHLMAIKHLWTWPNKAEKHWTRYKQVLKRFEYSQSKKCSTLFN